MADLPSLAFELRVLICAHLCPNDALAVALSCRALHGAALLHVYESPGIFGLRGWRSFCKGVAVDNHRAHRTQRIDFFTHDNFPPDDADQFLPPALVLPNVNEVEWHNRGPEDFYGHRHRDNMRVGSFLAVISRRCPKVHTMHITLSAGTGYFGPISNVPSDLQHLTIECYRPCPRVMPLIRACGANLTSLALIMELEAGPLDNLGPACPLLQELRIEAPGSSVDFDPPPLQRLVVVGSHGLEDAFFQRRFPGLRHLHLVLYTGPKRAGDDLVGIVDAITPDAANRWPSLVGLCVDVRLCEGLDIGWDEDEDGDGDDIGGASNEDDGDDEQSSAGNAADHGDGDEHDGGSGDHGDGDGHDGHSGESEEGSLRLGHFATQTLDQVAMWARQRGVDFDYTVDRYRQPSPDQACRRLADDVSEEE